MRSFVLISVLFMAACSDSGLKTLEEKKSGERKETGKVVILIQPFDRISKEKVELIRDEIDKFYKCGEVRLAKPVALPQMAWYEPRKRYVADSLLSYLRQNRPPGVDYVIGLTDKDIATEKGEIKNYGVMGLGCCPGGYCVVSTFRIKKKVSNQDHFNERFAKVCLHEVGHNFGLPHCIGQDSCFMNDADGTVLSVDKEKKWLCENCRKKIKDFLP